MESATIRGSDSHEFHVLAMSPAVSVVQDAAKISNPGGFLPPAVPASASSCALTSVRQQRNFAVER